MTKHLIKLLALAAFVLACVAFTAPQATAHAAIIITVAAIAFTGIGFVHHLRTRTVDSSVIWEMPTRTKSGRYKLDFVIAEDTFCVIVKRGSDDYHVAVCGVGDIPLGVIYNDGGNEAAIEDNVTVHYFNGQILRVPVTAAAAINAHLYTAALGSAQIKPTASGTYYRIGRVIEPTAGADQWAEIVSNVPVLVKGLVLFGNTNGEISALTSSATTTQAEFNALRDKLEETADDLRALQTNGAEPCEFIFGLAT